MSVTIKALAEQLADLNMLTSSLRSFCILAEKQADHTPVNVAEVIYGLGYLAEAADDKAAEIWSMADELDLFGADPVEELSESFDRATDAPEAPVEAAMITSGELAVTGRKFPYPGTPEAKAAVERVRLRNKQNEESGNHLMSGNAVVKRRGRKKKGEEL